MAKPRRTRRSVRLPRGGTTQPPQQDRPQISRPTLDALMTRAAQAKTGNVAPPQPVAPSRVMQPIPAAAPAQTGATAAAGGVRGGGRPGARRIETQPIVPGAPRPMRGAPRVAGAGPRVPAAAGVHPPQPQPGTPATTAFPRPVGPRPAAPVAARPGPPPDPVMEIRVGLQRINQSLREAAGLDPTASVAQAQAKIQRLEARNKTLEAEVERLRGEIAASRGALETAEEPTDGALADEDYPEGTYVRMAEDGTEHVITPDDPSWSQEELDEILAEEEDAEEEAGQVLAEQLPEPPPDPVVVESDEPSEEVTAPSAP